MGFAQIPFYHYIIMGFGWPSIFLYLLMIVSIVKNRRRNALLRSSFFNMVLAGAIPEIILFLYIEILSRPRKFGIFQLFQPQENSLLVQAIFFGHNALKYVVVLGFLPFALNRFTALRSPTSYTKIWSVPFTLFLISLCWIVGIAIALPIFFFPDANFSYVPSKSLGGLALTAGDRALEYDAVSAISTVVSVFIICSILYVLSFLSLKRIVSGDAKASSRIKDDVLLLISSILTFSTLALDVGVYAIQHVAAANDNGDLVALSFDLWFVTTELMCVTQPWCLLCTNLTVRRYFLRLIRLRRDTSSMDRQGISRVEPRTMTVASGATTRRLVN